MLVIFYGLFLFTFMNLTEKPGATVTALPVGNLDLLINSASTTTPPIVITLKPPAYFCYCAIQSFILLQKSAYCSHLSILS